MFSKPQASHDWLTPAELLFDFRVEYIENKCIVFVRGYMWILKGNEIYLRFHGSGLPV